MCVFLIFDFFLGVTHTINLKESMQRWRAALLQLPYLFVAILTFNSAVEQVLHIQTSFGDCCPWRLHEKYLGWATNQQCNLCLYSLCLILVPSMEAPVEKVKMIAEPSLCPVSLRQRRDWAQGHQIRVITAIFWANAVLSCIPKPCKTVNIWLWREEKFIFGISAFKTSSLSMGTLLVEKEPVPRFSHVCQAVSVG